MEHTGDSLFLVSSERLPFSERAVLLRGVKGRKSALVFSYRPAKKKSPVSSR
jgi:hypothetical protein